MTLLTIIFYSLIVLICWIIFYYVVKASVRNGIREALSENDASNIIENISSDKPANFEQTRLQQQYNNGEISFEEFKSKWDKLISK
ncbi:MAG: hypothetical protein JNK20_13665 [Flavipsychrobacter sp.]|nr:hypothetical protein [Flavipsychrobacter sp.]